MRFRLLILIGAVLTAAGGLASLFATPAGPPDIPGLDRQLQVIRSTFLAGNARQLGRYFAAGRPVYVSIPGFEPGRFLGPGPLLALLERLMSETRSVSFEYSGQGSLMARTDSGRSITDHAWRDLPRDAGASPRHVYVKARWTYQDVGSEVRQNLDLYLAIQRQPENGEWRIVEVKALN